MPWMNMTDFYNQGSQSPWVYTPEQGPMTGNPFALSFPEGAGFEAGPFHQPIAPQASKPQIFAGRGAEWVRGLLGAGGGLNVDVWNQKMSHMDAVARGEVSPDTPEPSTGVRPVRGEIPDPQWAQRGETARAALPEHLRDMTPTERDAHQRQRDRGFELTRQTGAPPRTDDRDAVDAIIGYRPQGAPPPGEAPTEAAPQRGVFVQDAEGNMVPWQRGMATGTPEQFADARQAFRPEPGEDQMFMGAGGPRSAFRDMGTSGLRVGTPEAEAMAERQAAFAPARQPTAGERARMHGGLRTPARARAATERREMGERREQMGERRRQEGVTERRRQEDMDLERERIRAPGDAARDVAGIRGETEMRLQESAQGHSRAMYEAGTDAERQKEARALTADLVKMGFGADLAKEVAEHGAQLSAHRKGEQGALPQEEIIKRRSQIVGDLAQQIVSESKPRKRMAMLDDLRGGLGPSIAQAVAETVGMEMPPERRR